MAVIRKVRNPPVRKPKIKQAVQRAVRPGKSQVIVEGLKHMSHQQVDIQNPFEEMMSKAAKHIEWLELLLSGISGRERQTIAKLTRLTNRQKKMINDRDIKLELANEVRKASNADHKYALDELKETHKDEVAWLKRTKLDTHLPGLREQIEKEFIAKLQTSKQIISGENAIAMLQRQLNYANRSTNGGWQSGTSTTY